MKKGKHSAKLYAAVLAVVLLLSLTACFGSSAIIKQDNEDFCFEFGKRINLPDTTVFNESGEPVAYDSVCVAMVAPDGSEVDVSTGFVTPMQVGTYILTYESASQNVRTDIEVECKDTIAPSLSMTPPEAYLIKEKYEDTELTVFTLPIISADDLAGIDVDRTEVSITVDGVEIPLDGDRFTLPTEGKIVFTVTVFDLNGLKTTITAESLAVEPELFDEYCLSSFAKQSYLAKICQGWLYSYYEASVLESDTDPSGKTMEGVLKITYDISDREAGACIHLARPIKRTDVQSIEVTFRTVGGRVADGNMNTVIFKSRYYSGWWTVSNMSILNDGNYHTYSIPANVLNSMTGDDGYIREITIETFGNYEVARSLYVADISYTPVGAEPPKPTDTTLIIGNPSVKTNDKNTIYLPINVSHGAKLYATISSFCNEETHVTINDQPLNGQEFCAFEGNVFYIGKINAEKGTKVTIKAGYTMTVDDISYVTAEDYNFWWSGTNWVTTEVESDAPVDPSDPTTPTTPSEPTQNVLTIGAPSVKTFDKNTIYLPMNVSHGASLWATISSFCNEETHVTINDQPLNGQEYCAFEGKVFYIGKIGAEKGTKVTFKAGYTMTVNGVNYVTAEDYNYWWDGANWVTNEVLPDSKPAEEVLTIGAPTIKTTDKGTLYLPINFAHGAPLYTSVAAVCNEETHIVINDQAWGAQELCAFEGKVIYIGKIGATEGTKVTIKAGFTATANGINYVTAEDYNFVWDGSNWKVAAN